MIYFDHNATTPIDPRVVDAMLPYLHSLYGNPSSLHRVGRISRSAIDTAREQLAALLDAEPMNVVFTSGGTEANALAINSARGRRLCVSAIEHPSLIENALLHQDLYHGIEALPVDRDGKLLANVGLQHGDFVSVMLANNETGAIQDVAAMAVRAAETADVVVHTDAVQALGKIPVSFRGLGVQLMSVSSHKIYGPKGCGALVKAADCPLLPLQVGGDQEFGLRAGTENVAAIVGFGKAAELARIELQQRHDHLQGLSEYLQQCLRTIPGLIIFAEGSARLPNTVQFALPGINGEMFLMQLDQQLIAVSSGSACKAGSEQISPVLMAMGVESSLAKAAIRVSFGKDNQLAEIDQFVAVLKTLLERN
jgi:cysteine desulfurase